MSKSPLEAKVRAVLSRLLRDESGQGMTEYATMSTVLLLGTIAAGTAWPFTKMLFIALQTYVDFYFFCLNMPIG